MKRILFVDDEPKILEGLQRMLRPQRREWDMSFAVGAKAAIDELAIAPFDVVVTDMRMPGMDGAALLTEVKQQYPATVRIVLSGYSDSEAAARAAQVAHQFLNKPCNADMLRDAINRAGTLKEGARNDVVREVVGGIGALPALPGMYQRISQALSGPEPSHAGIAEVLEQDIGISAKLLQLVNSSFFGVGRRVTTVRVAVDLLGVRTVHALVLSTEIFRAFTVPPTMKGFNADDLSTHSLAVASLARRMVKDREVAESSHSIGLLHDVGKLVLADRIPERYSAVARSAAEAGVPLHSVERDELGVTHAEVGAYLLGLWGLPDTIVQAVADHHSERDVADPLEAGDVVRIANALVHGARIATAPEETGAPRAATILEQPVLAERLPGWRDLAADRIEERDRE